MKMRSISMGFVFSITTLMAFGLMTRVCFAVNLLESNVWSSVTVNNGVSGQVSDFADIDLDDDANLLVVAVPGESADVTNATFGGVSMDLVITRSESYARVRFYALYNPATTAGQTLSLVSRNNAGVNGGYSPQIYVFGNVDVIGDTPGAGRSTAGTVILDFGAVTNNSYLLIAASANTGGNLLFEAPAIDLTGPTSGTGGWEGRTAGETISADAAGKTVDVTTDNRVTTIGLELLPLPLAPAGTMFKFQ